MSEDIVTAMTGRTTAEAVWTAVHDMFNAQDRASVHHVRIQLQSLKKKDMTCAEYFRKMKALADQMSATGSPLSNDEIIDYILAGLAP
jgi:hypothetical protein